MILCSEPGALCLIPRVQVCRTEHLTGRGVRDVSVPCVLDRVYKLCRVTTSRVVRRGRIRTNPNDEPLMGLDLDRISSTYFLASLRAPSTMSCIRCPM